eukprot:1234495-Prymnesium_polylepis.1
MATAGAKRGRSLLRDEHFSLAHRAVVHAQLRGGVVQSEGAFPVPQVHSRLSQADCVQDVRGAGRL